MTQHLCEHTGLLTLVSRSHLMWTRDVDNYIIWGPTSLLELSRGSLPRALRRPFHGGVMWHQPEQQFGPSSFHNWLCMGVHV